VALLTFQIPETILQPGGAGEVFQPNEDRERLLGERLGSRQIAILLQKRSQTLQTTPTEEPPRLGRTSTVIDRVGQRHRRTFRDADGSHMNVFLLLSSEALVGCKGSQAHDSDAPQVRRTNVLTEGRLCLGAQTLPWRSFAAAGKNGYSASGTFAV
jgi:hypothetical protein